MLRRRPTSCGCRAGRSRWDPTATNPRKLRRHRVAVDGFWMQRHQVTNEQFRVFVDATDYVTVAQRPLDAADFPGAPVANLQPGSMVFTPTADRSIWATSASGGGGSRAPIGAGRRAQAATSNGAGTTPSSRSPTRTPRPTRRGPDGPFRPRPSGNEPLAAASRGPRSPGATTNDSTAASWPTTGTVPTSRGAAPASPASTAPRPSARSPPTTSGCTTWRATSGSGPLTGTPTTTPPTAARACCTPVNPRGGTRGRQPRSSSASVPGAAQGHQGRFAPVLGRATACATGPRPGGRR